MERNGVGTAGLKPGIWMLDSLSCVFFVAWVLLPRGLDVGEWMFGLFMVWTVYRMTQNGAGSVGAPAAVRQGGGR